MKCKCCDVFLNDYESRARDPADRTQFLDLCGTCRWRSNSYSFLEEDEVINKEDLSIDSSS